MAFFNEQHPLPGQTDPSLMPCAFCRRRIQVQGQPVFQTCSCKTLGPPVTVGALAAGAVLVLAGLWWLARRR